MQVTIRQFGDISEALLAKGCLDAAGIENVLTDVNMAWLEWAVSRGMRLMVDAADADAALEALTDSGTGHHPATPRYPHSRAPDSPE
jgi:hypothetical protein